MFDSAFKEQVHQECIKLINQKLETIKKEFRLYQDSAENETKSTAGDKHDTGKAMMQMEQEKLGVQLKELLNNKNILQSIDSKPRFTKVTSGSLVMSNHGIFFFAISMGKIIVDAQDIFIISMQSPLAKLMIGQGVKFTFSFNGRVYQILDIC